MGVTDHGDDLRRELERDRHGYTYGVIYTGQGIHPSISIAFTDATASGFKVTIAGVEHGSRHQERWQAEATINALLPDQRRVPARVASQPRSTAQALDQASPWFGERSPMLTPRDLDVFIHQHGHGPFDAVGVAYADRWTRHFDSLGQAEDAIAGTMQNEQEHKDVWLGPTVAGPWEPHDMNLAIGPSGLPDVPLSAGAVSRNLVDIATEALPEQVRG